MERSTKLNVVKAFPSAFRHVITQSKTSYDSFIGEVRANLKSKKDIISWIKTFAENTSTKWVASVSKCGKSKKTKFIVEMEYVCQSCKSRKDKISAKKNCLAFVNFRVLAESESSSSEDAYLKEGLFGMIKINFSHNHEINSFRVLRSNTKVLYRFQDCEEGIGKSIDGTTDPRVETSKNPSEKSNAPSCVFCNVCSNQDPKRTFFKFPKDLETCKRWFEACQDSSLIKKSTSELESLRVCSVHFVESDYAGRSKRRLKTDACPSLYIEKSSKHKKVPHKNESESGNKLKKLNYEGFASYESSSEESSDFDDEVPMDLAFGFERDNAAYEKIFKFGRFTHEGALSVEIRPVSPRAFHRH